MPEMSMEQYSKHKGVSRAACQKALKNGRITVCRTEQRGRRTFLFIDSDVADAAWTQNTDLRKKTTPTRRERRQEARASKRGGKKTGNARAPQPDSGSAGAADSAKPSSAYLASRAMQEEYRAKQTRLDFETSAGRLVPVDRLNTAFANIGHQIQSSMLSIPSRLSALVAGEYKTQITALINNLDAGTPVTKADLVKWIETISDDKIVSDLLMVEIKKILQEFSNAKIY